MAPLKVLICGGGCAGPALAYWLARSGHRVVVVERFPALRVTGAQIDIRAQGIEAIKRMGLIDIVRSKVVDEAGFSIVDSQGNTRATVLANKSGKGAQSFTSEYEIMRGDLVRLLYDATKDRVEYIFGKTVESFEEDDKQVVAHFSDGSSDAYDLLVGADGQGSRIRKAILPAGASDPYLHMGIYLAYWFIPRTEDDNNLARSYLCSGGRMIMRRSHNPTETQVYFFLQDDSEETRSLPKAPIEQQKEFWTQKFQGAGWQTDRFLQGLKTTENFYCQEVVQVRIDKWHSRKGRVVLLGDAAHCPSPFTAMGTTSAFTGAYVLAGEISRNPDNLSKALTEYERVLRPFVNEIQKINTSLIRWAIPKTQFGIAIMHFIMGLICYFRIPEIVARFSSEEKGGWKLPDYPELNASIQK
ncbi:hypothetical protein F5884DRAFT_418789 [Xylogone sp. PMI_703]|nr:hypothetical protein F5884DRAFT_418789 [Xylogone sp. PMI_703]